MNRRESRQIFVAKVAALLQRDVCVSVVDLVTSHHFNLYSDLLELMSGADPLLGEEPRATYTGTLRRRERRRKRPLLDTWYFPLQITQALPTLPIWLDVDKGVMLNLETSYEETCRLLHIT